MATTNINDYLDAKVVTVAALNSGGTVYFNRVERAATIDPQGILLEPRWPAAFIIDMGGELSAVNGKVWNRAMAIVIAVCEPQDVMGAIASRELIELAAVVQTAFEADRSDDGIAMVNDSDAVMEDVNSGSLIYTKTLMFIYEIEKDD